MPHPIPPHHPAVALASPRPMGAVNWRGAWALYLKEVRRFFKVPMQTIGAPMVVALLFLAVFSVALGRSNMQIRSISFPEFLAPGLIMMAVMQNAFSNTSSSLIVSKLNGNIIDLLMAPLSPLEVTTSFALAGATRGVVVGLAIAAFLGIAVKLHAAHPGYIVFHAISAGLMLSLLGLLAGIWSESFEHMTAVTAFIITPLTFLSGTFYSFDRLYGVGQVFARYNPFFYIVDGFRYGFIGHADTSTYQGLAISGIMNVVLFALCCAMLRSGYKLKS